MKALVFLALFLSAVCAFGQDYTGADALLNKLRSGDTTPPKTQDELRADLTRFVTKSQEASPEENAAGWLQLYDEWSALKYTPYDGNFPGYATQPMQFADVMRVLPPPSSWSDLSKKINARKSSTASEICLRMLGETLTGDEVAWKVDLLRLKGLKIDEGMRGQVMSVVEQLGRAHGNKGADPATVVAQIERNSKSMLPTIELPDWVSIFGEARAKQILERILPPSKSLFSVPSHGATEKLARAVALENVARLKTLQWALAQSFDASALYEALKAHEKKVLIPSDPEQAEIAASKAGYAHGEKVSATIYYMLAQAMQGHNDKAAIAAQGIPTLSYGEDEPFTMALAAGGGPKVAKFLSGYVASHPGSPLLEQYITIAKAVSQESDAESALQKGIANPKLAANVRSTLQGWLAKLWLAEGKTTQAIPLVVTLASKEGDNYGSEFTTQLAKLGVLLQRKDLVEKSIELRKARLDRTGNRGYNDTSLYPDLLAVGRGAEAESLLQNRIASSGVNGVDSADIVALCGLYAQAHRWKDIIELMDKLPSWQADDLADVYRTTDPWTVPLGQVAAEALFNEGHREEAIHILHALLEVKSDYDPSYELLIEAEGEKSLPFLDHLFSLDRFEERPLIWKGRLLYKLNRMDDAEKTARQAIAVDPSDGETPHGQRMIVYGFLADILDAKGQHDEATTMRSVVKAIRQAERADDFLEAGLDSESIRLYRQSLTFFDDAYCIQSRLAIQLADAGDEKGAEEHYRKAFELMPSSFGRVESHCFGCEGVFKGQLASKIAEQVFSKQIKDDPSKPQPYYLLAYLRQNQERWADSVPLLEKAVAIDPDYLNAWKLLSTASEHATLASDLTNRIALTMVRLDPLMRHTTLENSNVTDLASLYSEGLKAMELTPKAPSQLYPFGASTQAMGDQSGRVNIGQRYRFRGYDFGDFDKAKGVGDYLAATARLQPLVQMIEYGRM